MCGTPRGAGRMFSSRIRPRTRLSAARSRSPCSTTTSTAGWLSSAVENTSLRRVGMVVLRSMTFVISPPSVSTPSESGVTSSSTTSWTSPLSTPAWIAAPSATTSSGLTVMLGSLPPAQHQRGDLLRRDQLAPHLEPHHALRALDDVVGHGLDLLGDLLELPADEPLRRID